jgi:YD repeat-containing protein
MSYRRRQYQYDSNGSLTRKIRSLADGTIITWSYTCDYENRLIKAEKDSDGVIIKTVTFKYDPFGRRIEKKIEKVVNGAQVTKTYTYLYDNEDIILETFTKVKNGNTTTKITKYIHGPGIDEPLAIEKDGIPYYYHADGLGSITHLTDSNQAVIESYTYDVFGKQTRYGDTVKDRYTHLYRKRMGSGDWSLLL